jgi:hypothetical protein
VHLHFHARAHTTHHDTAQHTTTHHNTPQHNTPQHNAQAELAELRSLVEGLSRKNRHLAEELSEASRAAEGAHTQLLGLQASWLFDG